MAVPAASFAAYGPARTRRERHVAYRAKVGRSEIDSKIGILHLNVINPALRHVLKKDGVVTLLFKVARIRRPGKVNSKMFDSKLLHRRRISMDFWSPLGTHVIGEGPLKFDLLIRNRFDSR